MTIEKQVNSLRYTAGYWLPENVCCLWLRGDDAFELMDRICPANLYLQDGQMLHTVFLDQDAKPIADAYVCLDDEDFFVLAEGILYSDLVAHIKKQALTHVDYSTFDLGTKYRLLSLSGPFAWEVAEKLLGPDVIGIPYMTFYHSGDIICFRGGKTGEWGYDLLVPNDNIVHFIDKLESLEGQFSMEEISRDALDVCMLENWFFNIEKEGRKGLTPLELQLQWRVSYDKEYVGKKALLEHKAKLTSRITTMICDRRVEEESEIFCDNKVVGTIARCERSPILNMYVCLGLLELPYAYPGLDCFETVTRNEDKVSLQTVSPPVINNLSLHINPQMHSIQNRDQFSFPPLENRAAR